MKKYFKLAEAMINNVYMHGGVTAKLDGTIVNNGFVCGVYNIYAGKMPEHRVINDIAESIETSVKDYHNAIVGGWVDKETNILYLDIVSVCEIESEAIALAKQLGELAIYNLGSKEEIRL